MNMFLTLIIVALATTLIFLAIKYSRLKDTMQLIARRSEGEGDEFIQAAQVPGRLFKEFKQTYGQTRAVDNEIAVCFRYKNFHRIYEVDDYPVDAKNSHPPNPVHG